MDYHHLNHDKPWFFRQIWIRSNVAHLASRPNKCAQTSSWAAAQCRSVSTLAGDWSVLNNHSEAPLGGCHIWVSLNTLRYFFVRASNSRRHYSQLHWILPATTHYWRRQSKGPWRFWASSAGRGDFSPIHSDFTSITMAGNTQINWNCLK